MESRLTQLPEPARPRALRPLPRVGEPPPTPAHAWTHARLAGALFGLAEGLEEGWWICLQPEIQLGPGLGARPDLAGWRRDRLPQLPQEAFSTRPDWVAEILSPGNHARDRVELRRRYGACEVPFLWLLDPEERVLEGFAWDEGMWILLGAWTEGDRVGLLPFERVDIDIGGLFPPR